MAAVQFEGDSGWHALMSIGAERLSDYDAIFPTAEGAKSGAYIGVKIYLDITRFSDLRPLHTLEWIQESEPDQWVEHHYAKPIWPP
jgi:hypothetical protein